MRAGGATASIVLWTRRLLTGLLPNMRSFMWAFGRLRAVRAELRHEGADVRVPLAVGLGPRGWAGVRTAIAVARPTCLERALLIQSWIGGYMDPPDVVIGVRNRDGAVEAHAWVDGRDPWFDQSYEELARLPR